MDDEKDKIKNNAATSIAPSLLASSDFDKLYAEGMGLIEDIATYLDGDGRVQSRQLDKQASMVYATQSMRLTTRLMQLASWLLLQRAVAEGEISANSARDEKEKVRFSSAPKEYGGPGWDDLPEQLRKFIAKGDRLYERVVQFDNLDRISVEQVGIKAKTNSSAIGGIAEQLMRIKTAFGEK